MDVQTGGSVQIDQMVNRVRLKVPGAQEELRGFLLAGPRFLAARHFGPTKAVRWCLSLQPEVVDAIEAGTVCDELSLLRFVQRRLATMRARAKATGPPNNRINHRITQVSAETLQALALRDRAALFRYYVSGDDEETICGDLSLTMPEFRALRRRVKSTITSTDCFLHDLSCLFEGAE